MSEEEATKLWGYIVGVRIYAANGNATRAEWHMDAARKLIVKHSPDWGKP